MQINNLETFGYQYKKVSIADKFKIINGIKPFKKTSDCLNYYDTATVFLIPKTNIGVVSCWYGYEVFTFKKIENQDIYSKQEYKKIGKNLSLEEYILSLDEDVLNKWIDDYIGLELFNQRVDEKQKEYIDKPNYYYEIDLKSDTGGRFCLGNHLDSDDKGLNVEFDRNGISLEIGGLCLGGVRNKNYCATILGDIISYLFKSRHLFDDFKQIENGFIFNDKYYEELDHILFDIEDIIKDKKLINKFMNEGLTLDDFKEVENG